jgi:UPF0042 nucleotide-binding protein
MKGPRLFILTGISGAGKSQALKSFEDFGFNCVDNLPIALIEKFGDHLLSQDKPQSSALGIDIREGGLLGGFAESVKLLRAKGINVRVVFIDAIDRVVVQRYSETRHRHPLGRNILLAVREERRRMADIKGEADKVLDTSDLTLGELKEKISELLEVERTEEMNLSVLSFGFKHGIPIDADLVMDVRFLPNPNYRPALKGRNGLDRAVQSFVLKSPIARKFLLQFSRLVASLLPYYTREGKSYLTVAVGCTGGRHRSVCVTHWLARALERSGYKASEFHRDMQR